MILSINAVAATSRVAASILFMYDVKRVSSRERREAEVSGADDGGEAEAAG